MKFPNESKAYRAARNKLLSAEKALRRKVEAVAALRRKLPAGGTVPEDYVFEEIQNGKPKKPRYRNSSAHTTRSSPTVSCTGRRWRRPARCALRCSTV